MPLLLPPLIFAVAVGPIHELWGRRLASARRIALACATLFGPPPVQRLVGFSALSHVTAVLIMREATTLGDTVRGCWHVLWATVQTAVPAAPSLRVIRVGGQRAGVAAGMVGGRSVRMNLMTKRIAFWQIVMVYVGGFIQAEEAGVVSMQMQLLHVASSTAIAALSSLSCCPSLAMPPPS